VTTSELRRIGLPDERNSRLHQELLKTQRMETVLESRNDYLAHTIGNKATIYVPADNLKPSYYTHELLHIFLRTKQVNLGSSIILYIESKPTLREIF
jgi:hypothetical protein